ncbi:DsbC family protein [Chiayiivirga flava]|uniref:Thiol:disulfide interchange protein n=1 Tax=Chiayiivirga flava TaxID=659595 RepID=A0A7W8FZP5_9GAMM|nr:DsbC family protein [Chiayiivirga flava]MBB5208687.1 thiol:disulfide interchange protein DsbC [Chiayiivirga flava]
MVRFLAAALFGALSLSAHAEDAKVKAAIQSLVPGASIDSIADAAVPGFYEVVVQGQIVYVSADGKYLIQGSIFDIANKTDLTENARAGIRKTALAGAPKDQRIVYGEGDAKHTITVFTDIDCGYCRRMHAQMAEYNKLGIRVEYLFFPRAGIGSESFDKAVSVWCADDRAKALTDAKAGQAVDKKECANPVEKDYALGQKIAVSGTPAVFAPDGTQLGGYLPPDQMLQRLDQLAAKSP